VHVAEGALGLEEGVSLSSFLRDDAADPRYQLRGFDYSSGQLATYDLRGYCPGSCMCLPCSKVRATIKRRNACVTVATDPTPMPQAK
jgi:hypothetical protein